MSRLLCTLALALTTPALASAQIVVTLKNKFIEDNKHRATIEATFTVDKAHKNPNPPSKDADIHVAGRAPEIQLPIVAELMNAKEDTIALGLIHSAETSGTPVAVTPGIKKTERSTAPAMMGQAWRARTALTKILDAP